MQLSQMIIPRSTRANFHLSSSTLSRFLRLLHIDIHMDTMWKCRRFPFSSHQAEPAFKEVENESEGEAKRDTFAIFGRAIALSCPTQSTPIICSGRGANQISGTCQWRPASVFLGKFELSYCDLSCDIGVQISSAAS